MPSDYSFRDSDSLIIESPIDLTDSEEAYPAGPTSSSSTLRKAVIATRLASPPVMWQGVASEPSSSRTSLDSDGQCDHRTENARWSAPVSRERSSSRGDSDSLPASPSPRLVTVRKQRAPLPKPPVKVRRSLPRALHSASALAPMRSLEYVRPLPPIPVPPSGSAHVGETPQKRSNTADSHIPDNSDFDSDTIPPSPSRSNSPSTSASFPPTPPPPKAPKGIRFDACKSSSHHMNMQSSHSKIAPLAMDLIASESPESAIGRPSTSGPRPPDEISILSPLPPDIPVAPSPVTAKRKQVTKLTRFLGETITEEAIDEHILPVEAELDDSWSLENGRELILKALIIPNRYVDNSEWLSPVSDENRLSMHWVYEKRGARHLQDDYNQVLRKLRVL